MKNGDVNCKNNEFTAITLLLLKKGIDIDVDIDKYAPNEDEEDNEDNLK